MRQCIDSFVD